MQVALLHPGDMGATIGAALISAGQDVNWVSAGRSAATRARADAMGLTALPDLASLAHLQAAVSVCPPHAALDLARDVSDAGFKGLYIDANAVAPQTAVKLSELFAGTGATLVDGGIIGGPTREPGRTFLHLSGRAATDAAALFKNSFLETRVVSEEIGAASALKMCYAAYSKGTSALLLALLTAAKHYGVDDALTAQWSVRDRDLLARSETIGMIGSRAWRWSGEMLEISTTFEGAGLPRGFHDAAAVLFERLDTFKDCAPAPTPQDLIAQIAATASGEV